MKEKPSLLKDVIDKPENFKLEAYIENEERVVIGSFIFDQTTEIVFSNSRF